MTADQTPPSGLRERKKTKTRASIREQALRLFSEAGYENTTMEQIAAAAEVSPSTVFRYFPTKEDLVASEGFGALIAAAYETQPAHLSAVAALRGAFGQVFADLTADDLAETRARQHLTLTVGDLWARNLDSITGTHHLITTLVANRLGRSADDPEIRSLAGAALGIVMTVWADWGKDENLDVREALDAALKRLEPGFPW